MLLRDSSDMNIKSEKDTEEDLKTIYLPIRAIVVNDTSIDQVVFRAIDRDLEEPRDMEDYYFHHAN